MYDKMVKYCPYTHKNFPMNIIKYWKLLYIKIGNSKYKTQVHHGGEKCITI